MPVGQRLAEAAAFAHFARDDRKVLGDRLTDLAAMSSELTSGMPPDRSVASVRETCAVASVRASGPKYGTRRIAACRRLRCPGCRNQSTDATTAAARPPKITVPLPTRFVESATTIRVDIGNAAPSPYCS